MRRPKEKIPCFAGPGMKMLQYLRGEIEIDPDRNRAERNNKWS